MITVYDLEQFKNFHSCYAIDINTKEEYYFEVSDFRDDRKEYKKFLESQEGMIGFNNLGYDYPLIHFLLFDRPELWDKVITSGKVARILYEQAQEIVDSKWSPVAPWDVKIEQRDLYKIHHFDNRARSTSLKDLQIAMNWDNVQDLPFHHSIKLTAKQAKEVKPYNRNDVLSTYAFYQKSQEEIKLRYDLKNKYGINCLNWNDPKIGEMLLLKMIAKVKGISQHILKKQRTKRDVIDLGKCFIDYEIKNEEIQEFKNTIKNKVITSTKGSVKHRVIYDGMPYDFGTGGIHGCKRPNVYHATNKVKIIEPDVSSYYPNISIRNNLSPKHLGKAFCIAYEAIYDRRQHAKDEGIKTEDKGLKLGLNGAFGKSNDEYSFLYDPKFTMQITINGQIMLSDLSVTLQKKGFDPIMINTDGLFFKVPTDREEEFKDLCRNWMKKTDLNLDFEEYSRVAVRDVNNYVAQKVDGSIKQKGDFVEDIQWHKDPSFKIIPKALKEYFINDKSVKEFIRNHNDIFDFCGRVKSRSGYKIWYHYLDGDQEKKVKLQKRNRIYISNKGGYLYKKKKERQMAVYKGQSVTVFNQYEEKDDYDIDYDWYIRETMKIIEEVEPKQQSLFN